MTSPDISQALLSSIENKSAKAGVIGLGYVGLPLAMTIARAGFKVVGFDIDPGKITAIDAGQSYIEAVSMPCSQEPGKMTALLRHATSPDWPSVT